MLLVTLLVPALAEPNQPAAPKPAAWFGLTLPHPGSATPAVNVGTRPPRPAEAGPGEATLAGAAIKRDVATIGETGGWAALTVAKVSVMQAPPLYHTTGEVLDVISAPGLERIARFLAFFVSAADRSPRGRINP